MLAVRATLSFFLFFFSDSSFSLREDVNMLYRETKDHWESYQTLQAIADREAARFQASRRFIAAYVQTLDENQDPFVDQVVDASTVSQLINDFPGVAYEERAQVAPLQQYLNAPPPPPVFGWEHEAHVPAVPSYSFDPAVNPLLQQAAQQFGTLPGSSHAPFTLHPAFPAK